MTHRTRWMLSEGLRIVSMLMLFAVGTVGFVFGMAKLAVWVISGGH